MTPEPSPGLAPKSRPPRIGAIILVSDPYWIQVLESIVHASQRLGAELVLLQPATTDESLSMIPNDELVDQILAFDLDAMVSNLVTVPVILNLVGEKVPVICLSEVEFEHPRFTRVSSLYEGGRMAGEYVGRQLDGKGHALCVTAGLERLTVTGQTRMAGFYDALQPYPGITIEHIPAYWRYSQAYPALLSALQGYPRRIDAVFGVSDTLIQAAGDAGRKLGVIDEHTLMVGLNGDPAALAAITEGNLSATVDTSAEYLGAAAVEIAYRAAQGFPQPAIIQHQFRLITRENVAGAATRKLTAIADIPSHLVDYNSGLERERLAQLEVGMEITQQIGSLQDRERIAEVVSQLVRAHYGYEWVRILRKSRGGATPNAAEGQLVPFGGNPSPPSQRLPLEQDWLLQRVYRTNEMIMIADTLTSRRWRLGKEWEPVRARALLPIRLGGEVIGVLDLQSSQPVRQPYLETVGLRLLASQLGIVIQNSDLYLEALQARETAERANQLKNRLVANVGHEMRTPLNAILGFSQAALKQLSRAAPSPLAPAATPGLREGDASEARSAQPRRAGAGRRSGGQQLKPEEVRQDVLRIYQSGEHLMYMINDLLDLSRAEIGALSLYFEQINPLPFLKELFASFAQAEPSTPGVAWRLDLPERLPLIRADAVRLRQVLANLLVNARKFTRQGSITLGGAVEPPHLHLWVSDTGPGVPFELQEKIFEPFHALEHRRRADGIGLGLSISRHLVALHDGIITLESQPGQGSTFHVYLPLPGVAQDIDHHRISTGRPLMLMLSTREPAPPELEQICARQGLALFRVSNREELRLALAEGQPQVIAWDLGHASPAEWALIQQISTDQECAALPVVLYGVDEESGQLAAGLTNVVFKPCSANVLKDWIGRIESANGASGPILVVDDDLEARQAYQRILNECYPHSRVLLAENGCQAAEMLKTELPAWILLDLMMPEMDGFTLLEMVRADPRTRRVPVIIISGKLLSYEDIQRLNHARTLFLTKNILSEAETTALFDQAVAGDQTLPPATSALVKQALAYLHQNYVHPITRKDIALAVGVSESYLSQIFRHEITLSPWEYLSRFRIRKACELLLSSQDTITQVAIRVGFNDSAYFSRVFHQMSGQSPQEYRKSGGK